MIKSQLIANLSSKLTDIPENDVAKAVNSIIDIMNDALIQKNRIEIRGFGSFALRYRKSRNAHNPKTGEKVVTAPKYKLHFKPGKELRDLVQKSLNIRGIQAED